MSFIRLYNGKVYNLHSIKHIGVYRSNFSNKKFVDIEFNHKAIRGSVLFFSTDHEYERIFEKDDPETYKQLEKFIEQTKLLE